MSYPESSNVSAGDATFAAHYNDLRADSVHLGMAAADAEDLGTVLEKYESRLEISWYSDTKVKVVASASAPVSLIIDGYLCQIAATIFLTDEEIPAGDAMAYYVFANRADSSTGFTLTVNSSITEAANQRLIGRFYWDSSAIVRDSIRTDLACFIADLLYFIDPQVCDGRLTLASGNPVSTTNIASSANVYFTPYKGNRISLYVKDYGWRVYTFSERTLDISGISTDKNIDVWIYDNAGTITLAYTEWSNNTLRATNLTTQDGVQVKDGAPEYRYLGTVRTSGAGVSCDTTTARFVWNFYHRTMRRLLKTIPTNTWTYAVNNVWRPINNSTANRVEVVIGIDETLVNLDVNVYGSNSGNNNIGVGIDIDSTNANNAHLARGVKGIVAGDNNGWYGSTYINYPNIGYHYFQLTELSGGGTTTFYGDNGSANNDILSGCSGFLYC